MKKITVTMLTLLLISTIFVCNFSYADAGVDEIVQVMSDANNGESVDETGKIGTTINNVIGLIQVAGVGITVVVITMLGIKYILASPGEKADLKKSALPIIIGAVLLFGAVSLMGAVEEFSDVIK